MAILTKLIPLDFAPPEELARLPAPLSAVVERALAPDPGARYASAAEMRAALIDAIPGIDLDKARSALVASNLEQKRPDWGGDAADPNAPTQPHVCDVKTK